MRRVLGSRSQTAASIFQVPKIAQRPKALQLVYAGVAEADAECWFVPKVLACVSPAEISAGCLGSTKINWRFVGTGTALPMITHDHTHKVWM